MAKVIKLYEKNTDINRVHEVVECLKNGGLIIYPTDTVYGLGCDIHQNRSVEALCKIKGIKPEKSNFAFICNDLSHIADYARVSDAAFKLMKKSLPGPFTYILEANRKVPKVILGNRKTVGIRIPDHFVPRLVVQELGNPIVTTSLKEDDILEYSTNVELIAEKYQYLVDIIIDGGSGGIVPSTIIDATTDDFEVIREGLGQIEAFL